ncbi:hypothetical protein RRG08_000618 [Elysia crispata]|uniref:Uncharacterized protein n=1 Tax=Elysia crispata TaxID=231223 RepID=A0AAE0Y8C9_9GAST|nr:hypothetical protein RRG08_000618 [Elysia crispata]
MSEVEILTPRAQYLRWLSSRVARRHAMLQANSSAPVQPVDCTSEYYVFSSSMAPDAVTSGQLVGCRLIDNVILAHCCGVSFGQGKEWASSTRLEPVILLAGLCVE